MRGDEPAWSATRVEAEHPDRARVRAPVALERLDRGRLAGAVRPEEGEHLAGLGGERQPVDGDQVAVPHDEPGDLDGGHGWATVP